MAALEGGVAAVAASSGQSAQFMAIAAIAEAGDNIVTTSYLYGGSFNQFKVFFKKFGSTFVSFLERDSTLTILFFPVEFRFVEGDDPADFAAQIDSKTKAICASCSDPVSRTPSSRADQFFRLQTSSRLETPSTTSLTCASLPTSRTPTRCEFVCSPFLPHTS